MKVPTTITERRWDMEADETTFYEVDFDWNGTLRTEHHVEGLVVSVEDDMARFVVTKIIDAEEDRFRPGEWRGLSTAKAVYPWLNEMPRSYRDLLRIEQEGFHNYEDELRKRLLGLDNTRLTDVELAPGDTIDYKLHYAWGKTSEGKEKGIAVGEVEILKSDDTEPGEIITALGERKRRLARQLVRSYEKRELLAMAAQDRLSPTSPTRPFETIDQQTAEQGQVLVKRYVYGEGPVKDHFVDVFAEKHDPIRNGLYGEIRFTANGRTIFSPHIMPFGEGSKDDPLHKVQIHIHSTTVLNPAVGEQTASITVDGTQYRAMKYQEDSSHYFDNPGHNMFYRGYRKVGVEFDSFWLDYERYDDIFNGPDNENRQAQLMSELSETEADEPIDTGLYMLVPRSMLDSIELVLDGMIKLNDVDSAKK